MGEAATGKDMFGNTLNDEQCQNSLMNALGITTIAGAAKAADKMASGSKLIPHSKEYVQNQVQKAQGSIKDMAKSIGKTEVPTGFKLREVADTTGSTHKMIDVDKTTIKDLAQKITAKGEGSKGAGNSSKGTAAVTKYKSHFLDELKLKPNVKYEINGYLYQTDDVGRIERASGELTLEMGERNNKHQLAAGGKDRVVAPSTKGDHGGHLIGTQFNGSPLIDNIVAMNGNVNVSAYKKLESAWAKALKDNRKVIVDIRPIYEANSERPVSFNIKYRIDGEKFKASLKNVYGGK